MSTPDLSPSALLALKNRVLEDSNGYDLAFDVAAVLVAIATRDSSPAAQPSGRDLNDDGAALSGAQIVVGLRNLGIDIDVCGACAGEFYTGHSDVPHDASCTRKAAPREPSPPSAFVTAADAIRDAYCDRLPANHSGRDAVTRAYDRARSALSNSQPALDSSREPEAPAQGGLARPLSNAEREAARKMRAVLRDLVPTRGLAGDLAVEAWDNAGGHYETPQPEPPPSAPPSILERFHEMRNQRGKRGTSIDDDLVALIDVLDEAARQAAPASAGGKS